MLKFYKMGKVKKLGKDVKSTKKHVIKLQKKKLKLEEDPIPANQIVEGASTEAGNNLRISKEHKKNKVLKKKDKLVKKEKRRAENASNGGQHQDKDTDGLDVINSEEILRNGAVEDKESYEIAEPSGVEEACRTGKEVKAKIVKKAGKRKRKSDLHVSEKDDKSVNPNKPDAEKVDEISSVDEDCSRGMKKWLIDYKDRRPGLKILQERIDEFITDYEAQQEQERKEREARAAEGGWTVVVHQKGRKKTSDAETGITVGSVAQAAVLDNMARKKNKEVAIDFYRFQKREAQRSEIMMLQSKFEQDKKRIQQLRAARKFRPY